MAKTIQLNVDIKTKYEEQLKSIKKINSGLSEAGGFSNHLGPERKNKIDALVSSIENKLKGNELSFESLTELKNEFKDLFKILTSVSTGVTKLSPEMRKLADEADNAKKELEAASKSRNDIVEKGTLAASKKEFKNIPGFDQKIVDIGAFRVTKDGKQYKEPLTKFETVNARVQKGEQILTKNGTRIQDTPEWKEMIAQLQQYNKELKEADQVLAAKTKAEQEILDKIQKQAAVEGAKGGAGGGKNVSFTSDLLNTESKVNKLTDTLYESKAEQVGTEKTINSLTTSINKQQSALGRAFRQFTIYNSILRLTKQALKEAVKTIQELDKSLTEQAMVTGMTREQTYGLMKSYQDLALQCGATTKEIAQVATEYMKQGKTIEDSLILTEAAVKAAKVARVSVGDSVNYLTTALNGFRLSAEDAMLVSDKFAAVAAASATDYDELAIALSKVASQANLAGMSIDYTTALLTKGLETTREAPETMGTALKTIIARMRELGDYGETLDGDTDINNVEAQLAYVDIALRDTNGELRSTEDVLDQLGQKWDTLNKNQQAAVAKALAGTRQQSRLIAMMEDYERVTELQQISMRSAGATSAQAATYLSGLEAKLNSIQVAWEKITTTITDSELIIGTFEFIGDFLDKIAEYMDSWVGQWLILPTIIGIVVTALVGLAARASVQNSLAKEQIKLQRENQILKLQERNEEILRQKLKDSGIDLEEAEYKASLATYKALVAQGKQIIQNNKLKANKTTAGKAAAGDKEVKEAQKQIKEAKKQEKAINDINKAQKDLIASNKEYATNIKAISALNAQNNSIMNSGYIILAAINAAQAFKNGLDAISSLFRIKEQKQLMTENILKAAGILLTGEETEEDLKKIAAQTGLIISNGTLTVSTWAVVKAQLAAIASNPWTLALAAIAVAAIVAISIAIDKQADSTENAAAKNRELSNEIYKATQNAQKIDEITSKYKKLDNQLIKTKEDQEEMNNLLESASELLDTEDENWHGKGMTEKEWFATLDAEEQYAHILQKRREEEEKAKKSREETIKNIREHQDMLDKDSEFYAETRADLIAANNAKLYENVDETNLSDAEKVATEELVSQMFREMSSSELLNAYDNNLSEDILIELQSAKKFTNEKGEIISAAEILTSDSYLLSEKVAALTELKGQLSDQALELLTSAYSDIEYFVTEVDSSVISFMDNVGITTKELNDFYGAWEVLQKQGIEIPQEVWESNFQTYLEVLAREKGDIAKATREVFGDYLGAEEENLNAFINAYGDLVSVGILNMGQNLDKVKNTINNFYEKALDWGTMSESEKAEFIQDNAELFNDGELLKAFESGNYKSIEEALSSNGTLQKQLQKRREEVEQELRIEEEKRGEARNEAYIAELQRYKEYLNNTKELFQASLQVRLEQQEKELEEYKSYLQDKEKAEEESLNKRKEAYEKYFDKIKQEEEDDEYEEEADLLVSNLSKLGSTSNANAQQQTKELEQKLEELEEQRLKDLRERAQEAIIQDIDDEIANISNTLDELLNNSQALLVAMQGDLEDPAKFVTDMITQELSEGQTALGMEDYIEGLKTTYGSVLGDTVDWEILKEEIHQLFMNVNGQEITLNEQEQQTVYSAVMAAMTQVGKR